MAEIQIKVKHQGKIYDLAVDPESRGEELKYQLFSLTNVEPANQKILAKKLVKDDTMLSALGLKDGTTITLIGNPSAEAMFERPEKTKFTEDMTEEELAQQEGAIPGGCPITAHSVIMSLEQMLTLSCCIAGLQNTGNTCYANASLQVLRSIPELQDALSSYRPAAGKFLALVCL